MKSFSKLFLNSKSRTYQLKPFLNHSDYVTSKQNLPDIFPDPIGESEQSSDYRDILLQKLKEYYHAHQYKNSTSDDCYEMNILLDILDLQKYSSNHKAMDSWMAIKSQQMGPIFSKLVTDCLVRALNNSLLSAQGILEQDSTSDISVIDHNLQEAITASFHSV